jgi:hypothetical protein
MARGGRQQAGRLLRAILANDKRAITAHDLAARAATEALPARVRGAIDQRAAALRHRAVEYARRQTAIASDGAAREARSRDIGLDRSKDAGLEL